VTRYTLETTGGLLVYEVVGEGDPVLFLAPRCYDRRVWSDVAVLLASSGVRSVMPDERGFGESGNAIGVVDPVREKKNRSPLPPCGGSRALASRLLAM
jgi:pimeloyl-ACP methyl ester carboxylesterase